MNILFQDTKIRNLFVSPSGLVVKRIKNSTYKEIEVDKRTAVWRLKENGVPIQQYLVRIADKVLEIFPWYSLDGFMKRYSKQPHIRFYKNHIILDEYSVAQIRGYEKRLKQENKKCGQQQ